MARPSGQWRALDAADKFAYLANHFEDADSLSDASGIPAKTIKSIFATLNQGKHSHVLERSEIAKGLQRARHRMTDHIRRANQQAQRGRYVAPVARIAQAVIPPFQYGIQYEGQTKRFTSHWIGYHVEHLPHNQIIALATQLFELYIQTGQFNTFRFEYIARTSEYLSESDYLGKPRKVFMDKDLRRQVENSPTVIKLSTTPIGFDFSNGDPAAFETLVEIAWQEVKAKGAIRITDIYFTKFSDREKIMGEVRADYKKLKGKRHAKRKGPKGGAR